MGLFAKGREEDTSQRKCAVELAGLDAAHRREVMSQLCFDRIDTKQEFISDAYHDTENWNETAYFMLMRSLDIGHNRHVYELLARLLPYRILNKVSHDKSSIQALLLGSAGLLGRLSEVMSDNHEIAELLSIYEYDSHKYNLQSLSLSQWQLVGVRGDNHPVVRLLQVANIISQCDHLLDALLECRTGEDVERLFCRGDIPLWAYRFLSESSRGAITRTKAQMLGINVVAQMQISYSEYTMRSDLNTRGLDLLEQLPAENNVFVRRWAKLGVVAENALDSQALLQLSKAYCANSACDKCPFRRFITTM